MAKEIRIAPVEQHIINQVRKIRQQLKITAEDLSQQVSPSKDKSFIGNIESSVKAATYTDHNLNIIAAIFSQKAKLIGDSSVKKEYTLYDFYPEDYLDDKPIVKIASKIIHPVGKSDAVTELARRHFFDPGKSSSQTTNAINELLGEKFEQSALISTLAYAVKKGELIRIDLKDGGVLYQTGNIKPSADQSGTP